jgi:endogenous inhibitor of DNA gyrase (YacG/DUF329 family)
MARKLPAALRCPACKKPANRGDEDFPFCSERCRLIDLGKWASGAYVIPSPLPDSSNDQIGSDDPDED